MSGLEDPTYVPKHPPVNGEVPTIVGLWGSHSQLRWFDRFRGQLAPQPSTVWNTYYCSSSEHRGHCCESCEEDQIYGYDDIEPHCCCKATWDKP